MARLDDTELQRAHAWCGTFEARDLDAPPAPGLQDEAEWLYGRLYAARCPVDNDALWCAASPALWAERRLGYLNALFHMEWYKLARSQQRLCVVAPREHAKSQVFTVNLTAWTSIYCPGFWTYIFGATDDLAAGLKARIDAAVEESDPELILKPISKSVHESVYANGSRVAVAGAGKAVRGAHPDRVIGDDVLTETGCLTEHQRRKTSSWWLGTVAGMAHPGTVRVVRGFGRRHFPSTQIILVGTPFHRQDLLMGMRTNPLYAFYRYAAEFDPAALPKPGESLAVEIA
jgi:hypothetical protein